MKKIMMVCITAALMLAPLAAYARGGRVIVATEFRVWVRPVLGRLSVSLRLLRQRSGNGRGEV